MELLEKMLREETDLLLNQISLIHDKTRRDEIIKTFLVSVNSLNDSISQIITKEKSLDINEFIKNDDGINKLPTKKREFTENEREILNQHLRSIEDITENKEEENRRLYELMKSNNIIERTKAREELIKGNMKLALRFLSIIILSYSKVTNLEDLINEINIDLIKSVNYYNPEMGPLKNLLFFTIKRTINERIEIESKSPEVPTNIKKLDNLVTEEVPITGMLDRNNVDYSAYINLKNILLSNNSEDESEDEIEYLDIDIDNDYIVDPSLINLSFENLALADKEELKNCIKDMLKTLNPKEADILTLRFGLFGHKPMSLETIGEKYNLTKERIKVIEERALRKLRHTAQNTITKRSM